VGQYLKEPLEIDGSPVQVSASMGISIFPQDGTDTETLINNADKAMYKAKELGRGGYRLFAEVLQSEADSRLALETVLRTGLREDSFSVQYQPRVDLATGQVVAAEVCLRWPDMQRFPMGEPNFIAVAEESGLIVPLGKMALTKSCRECRDWRDRLKPGPRISLRLCTQQLANKLLAEQISHTLTESGMPPEALELEVSESYLAVNPEKAAGALEQLADLGVHLTVCDFGVGRASLYQLKFLPVNFIKIGESLLEDLPGDEAKEAILSAIIAMGHSLGLKVVAEGVENKTKLEFLRTQGCDLAQGSMFGGFVTAEELIDALTTQGQLNPTSQ
jgi:predicted signal transduction protein with EAL and GGDEF domain